MQIYKFNLGLATSLKEWSGPRVLHKEDAPGFQVIEIRPLVNSVKCSPPMVEASPPTLLPLRILAKWEEGFIRDCVSVLVQLFKLYGFQTAGYSSLPTVNHWLILASYHENAMKFVKYKTAAFYAFWEEQDLPASSSPSEIDIPGVLLGGRAHRWLFLLSQKTVTRERFRSLLTSVLYSKKGMPRPPKKILRESEIETFKVLTTAPPKRDASLVKWGDIEDYPIGMDLTLSRDLIEKQLDRTVIELFKGQSMTLDDWIRPFFPSTSANYINSRGKGGAVGVILSDPSLLSGLKTDEELVTMNIAGSVRSKLEKPEGESATMHPSLRTVVDYDKLYDKFGILFQRILDKAILENPTVELLALAEALKSRCISKGPPYRMTVLKPLQKFMWSVVQKCPAAALIGMTVSDEYVQNRMGKHLPKGKKFLSVDYRAATDNLRSFISERIANKIADTIGMDEQIRLLFVSSLIGHDIVDPVSGELVAQKNGQLMGSITSFPILCIANLAICRYALEVDEKKFISLKDAKLGVNGDDGLLVCSELGRVVWERVSSFCGLEPSVGKVYFSDRFLNINSTTFDYSDIYPYRSIKSLRKDKDGSWAETLRPIYYREVKYVNLGLLFGLKRSGGKIDLSNLQSETGSIGARANDLINHCPDALKESVLCDFISRNNKLLRSARLPWFIPERFGGLGLPSVGRWKPDNRDLRIARLIFESRVKLPQKPISAPWKVWNYATKRFNSFPVINNPSFLYEYSAVNTSALSGSLQHPKTIMGMLCVEAIFRVKGIKEIYSLTTQKSGYLTQLQKIWSQARRSNKYPEPFDLKNLPPDVSTDDMNRSTIEYMEQYMRYI